MAMMVVKVQMREGVVVFAFVIVAAAIVAVSGCSVVVGAADTAVGEPLFNESFYVDRLGDGETRTSAFAGLIRNVVPVGRGEGGGEEHGRR